MQDGGHCTIEQTENDRKKSYLEKRLVAMDALNRSVNANVDRTQKEVQQDISKVPSFLSSLLLHVLLQGAHRSSWDVAWPILGCKCAELATSCMSPLLSQRL